MHSFIGYLRFIHIILIKRSHRIKIEKRTSFLAGISGGGSNSDENDGGGGGGGTYLQLIHVGSACLV